MAKNRIEREMYEIIYHERDTDNEWRDGALFFDEDKAVKHAETYKRDGEYFYICACTVIMDGD